jgi:hypothetical protein
MKPAPFTPEDLIESKRIEYSRGAQLHRTLYYCIRIGAGLSAGMLPFVVHEYKEIATGLSLAIVILTILDIVFNPKESYQLLSHAADMLMIQKLKSEGNYEKYKEQLDFLLEIEKARLGKLLDLEPLLEKIRIAATEKRST